MDKKRYCYYCTQRPAVPGAIPRGVVGIKEMDKSVVISEIGKGSYALVMYDRKLTEKETTDYELTWAYTEVTG